MMKRVFAVLLTVILLSSLLVACEGGDNTAVSQPDATTTGEIATTGSDAQIDTPTATDPPAVIGTPEDYVGTAKEAKVVYSEDDVETLRLPEILIDSADATAANKEIIDTFGKDCVDGGENSPRIQMDYEAYLKGSILSVYVLAKYENDENGLCYCFDVTTGSKLNNETLCSMTGRDYNTAISALTANVTSDYEGEWGSKCTDDERTKTLGTDNISASKMYLDDSGKLMAMVDFYAFNKHFIYFIAAEEEVE